MNLRNAPVDKRRLKAEDRNFDTSRRESAVKKAKQRRGSLAYEQNRQRRTTERTPGSGGFGLKGIEIQQQRLRDKGQEARRSKGLRPEKFSSPVEDPQ
tara:strand:- start:211 stop:504 length:294 start_codon:yes stop_codon:yes gene_type:complete